MNEVARVMEDDPDSKPRPPRAHTPTCVPSSPLHMYITLERPMYAYYIHTHKKKTKKNIEDLFSSLERVNRLFLL